MRSRYGGVAVGVPCKRENRPIRIRAMPIATQAKKYRKKIGSPTTTAPYFTLLQKKRRIKTNPPRTPKAIPRKNMVQTLSLNGNNIVTPFWGGGGPLLTIAS